MSSRQKRKSPRKKTNSAVLANRINKLQMTGAACELTTDDITKFSETFDEKYSEPSNNFAWLESAVDLISCNPDVDESGTMIDTVLLAAANTFKQLLSSNSLKLRATECLALGLFTLKLLLYSDAHDSHQEKLKEKSWFELVELVADLQVPLVADFNLEESFTAVCSKFRTIEIVAKFVKTIAEEPKEKVMRAYCAKTYDDVLSFYAEIRNRLTFWRRSIRACLVINLYKGR